MKLTVAIFALVTTIGIVSANSAPPSGPQVDTRASREAVVDAWLYDASGALVTVRASEPEWGADGPVIVRRPVVTGSRVARVGE